jgi:hypothetical protein
MKSNQQPTDIDEAPIVGLPDAVLDLLRMRWMSDACSQELFNQTLRLKMGNLRPTTCASSYLIRSDDIEAGYRIFSFNELKQLIDDGALPEWGYEETPDLVRLNEHVGHSFVQFFARVFAEWEAHEQRLERIRRTPYGRIRSR